MTGGSFTCPRCGAVSHNPRDLAEGYCARCHDWTVPGQQVLFAARPSCPDHGPMAPAPPGEPYDTAACVCNGYDGEGCGTTAPIPAEDLDWKPLGTINPGDLL